jgi:hypothetical protein
VSVEIDTLLKIIATGQHQAGRHDLEAIETATRAAMHRSGAVLLSLVLSQDQPDASSVACDCGQQARYHSQRKRRVLTALGEAEIERAYYYCPQCHQGQCPRDRELKIVDTDYSPGVRRMLAVVGSETSFDRGRTQLELLAGLTVTRKAVERHAEAIGGDIAKREQTQIQRALQLDLPVVVGPRIPILYIEMDGTSVPVVLAETEDRQGKNGEQAHSREVKLGAVFTQTTVDEEGRPLRDEASTTYTGAIEPAEQFGRRLYSEAWERGWSRADKKVVLGDGAVWIWNIADREFPGAIQIVDLYHAREHLWDLAGQVFADDKEKKRWGARMQAALDAGKIEQIVRILRSFPAPHPDLAETLRTEADYFERNAQRMRYPVFRQQKLFVGSGVIEAACRTVIAQRLKLSGMFWTVRGANAIIALRCCRLNARFDDYWDSRPKAA